MSIERGTTDWEQSDALDGRLDQPRELRFPEDWTLSESWERAQREHDRGGPLYNDAERLVWLETGNPHRVVFALSGNHLLGECSCDGYHYRGFCAHLASCWWRWVRGRLVVTHLDTGREYRRPPSWLRVPDAKHDETDDRSEHDFSGLTAAELDAYLTCDLGTTGVRECARKTGRAPGTVGNLLARARRKEEQR